MASEHDDNDDLSDVPIEAQEAQTDVEAQIIEPDPDIPKNPIHDFLSGIVGDAGKGYERKFALSSDYVEILISETDERYSYESSGEESDGKRKKRRRRKKKTKKLYRRPNLAFGAFFEEEESTYSVPQLHEYYGTMYRYTKLGCYNILMLVLGLPLIVIWGIILSILSFCMNWMYQPTLKILIWVMNATLPCLKPLQKCFGGFARVIGKACQCARGGGLLPH